MKASVTGGEPMRIVVVSSHSEVSVFAARLIGLALREKPACALGLAAGETPRLMYAELVRMHRESGLSFAQASAFALDEYLGLAPDNPASFSFYLRRHLLGQVDFAPRNIHLIDALAPDVSAECARYERHIGACGGIDLQVLGLGQNGHIGFNEPGTNFMQGVHHVGLTQATIAANARHFADPLQVPRSAISLGIRNILEAKKILLLVSGKNKSEALRLALCGSLDPSVPASVLQTHPDVTLVADREAASLLD